MLFDFPLAIVSLSLAWAWFSFSLGLGGIAGYSLGTANSWISLLLSVLLQLSLDLSSNG